MMIPHIIEQFLNGVVVVGFWIFVIWTLVFGFAYSVFPPDAKKGHDVEAINYMLAVIAGIWIGILIGVVGHYS